MSDWARVAALEAASRAALPALTEMLVGDWIVRLSGGVTKRVNSANPALPGAVLNDMRGEIEQCYADHNLPSRFRLTPLADPGVDAELARAGYQEVDPSVTMAARLRAQTVDPQVVLTSSADTAWHAASQRLQARADEAIVVQTRLLAAMPGLCAFASIIGNDATLASAYVSVGNGVAQISDVVVAPEARRRGMGLAVVGALTGWAHRMGCREAMLQVLEANVAARALYRALGFTDAYRYHYRVRR